MNRHASPQNENVRTFLAEPGLKTEVTLLNKRRYNNGF